MNHGKPGLRAGLESRDVLLRWTGPGNYFGSCKFGLHALEKYYVEFSIAIAVFDVSHACLFIPYLARMINIVRMLVYDK